MLMRRLDLVELEEAERILHEEWKARQRREGFMHEGPSRYDW